MEYDEYGCEHGCTEVTGVYPLKGMRFCSQECTVCEHGGKPCSEECEETSELNRDRH